MPMQALRTGHIVAREDAGPCRYRVPFADELDVYSSATTTPATAAAAPFLTRQDIAITGIQGHSSSLAPVPDKTSRTTTSLLTSAGHLQQNTIVTNHSRKT
ncbi:hypothetical protein ISCGN_026981 [Ixodes scapularis]